MSSSNPSQVDPPESHPPSSDQDFQNDPPADGYLDANLGPLSDQSAVEAGCEGYEPNDDDYDTADSADSNDIDLPGGVHAETASEQERARCRRRLILVRNAESMNDVFPNWWRLAFVGKEFHPYDQNMPIVLPNRRGGPFTFAADPPLTVMGSTVARLIGRQLKAERNLALIVSPALRCLETAKWMGAEMAQASDFDTPVAISVEPGLFDWTSKYGTLWPAWMRSGELKADGYTINEAYRPLERADTCLTRQTETPKEYQNRVKWTLLNILDAWQGHGDVVLVTHALTIECMMRCLLGREMSKVTDLDRAYPRGCIIVLEQSDFNRTEWTRMPDAIHPLTFTGCTNRPSIQVSGASSPNSEENKKKKKEIPIQIVIGAK